MSKTIQKHVVFSNGFTLSGFKKSEVSATLSVLYKIPKSKISRRLLNAKTRKIKSFDNEAAAKKMVAQLSKIGLNCYVLSPDSADEINAIDEQEPTEYLTSLSIQDVEPFNTSYGSQTKQSVAKAKTPRTSILKRLLPFLYK